MSIEIEIEACMCQVSAKVHKGPFYYKPSESKGEDISWHALFIHNAMSGLVRGTY